MTDAQIAQVKLECLKMAAQLNPSSSHEAILVIAKELYAWTGNPNN